MSLQLQSIINLIKTKRNYTEREKQKLAEFLLISNIFDSDQNQLKVSNLYSILVDKINSIKLTIKRSDRFGLDIVIEVTTNNNYYLILDIHQKRQKYIQLLVSHTGGREGLEPSGFLQKLVIYLLPQRLANILIYYIYNPEKHNWIEIENLVGPVLKDEDKKIIRTNYPDNWKMDNTWEPVTNFIFSITEAVNHINYNPGFPYNFMLDINACKSSCRNNDIEEQIKIIKNYN